MDPYGEDCPASAPLCSCGVRGCPMAEVHAAQAARAHRRRRMGRRRKH